jgi:four helix bundle protein
MAESVLKVKSYDFAKLIVRTCQNLVEKKEFVLSKQLLRSGTSIGALIREAEFGQSRPDFIHKLSIALKEANETHYWLSLLKDTDYLSEKNFQKLEPLSLELIKMLVSSIKTSKRNY